MTHGSDNRSSGDAIVLAVEDGIATITLNRPERRNALDYEGWKLLRSTAGALAERRDVRVVVIAGAGDAAFSAGADISDFGRNRSDSKQGEVYAEAFDGAIDAVEALPQPTLCLIKGACVGGGCELSLAADLRIAADNSRFGIPAAKLGILIGYGEMGRLVDLVGRGNASDLLLTGRLVDAAEALRMGLVNEGRAAGGGRRARLRPGRADRRPGAAVASPSQADHADRAARPRPGRAEHRRDAAAVRQFRLRGLPRRAPRVRGAQTAALRGPVGVHVW